MKKALALVLVLVLALSCFAACGGNETPTTTPTSKPAEKVVRFLNFKPEIADKYAEVAKAYEAATGVKLEVETAASGTYEQTLTARMASKNKPVLFQINGPVGYNNWKDYCSDLTNTAFYKHLSDKSLAVTSNGGVYGVPYTVEGYGIIYNDAIMTKYFALTNRATSYKSVEEVNNFAKLKEVVEDMQAHKSDLGIEGVFAATSLKPGEDWRWQTHLANLPLYYEMKDANKDTTNKIESFEFKYAENYKNIFDLFLNNSTTNKKQLGTVDVNTSMAELAKGQCAMVQNGNWGAGQILGVEGNTVANKDIKFMPIYTGVAGEENQGLCIGTENFLSINSKCTAEEQKLAADFLEWLFTTSKGLGFVKDLGFAAPFDTVTSEYAPTDPLGQQMVAWMGKEGHVSVPWYFTIMPSQQWKDDFGANLLKYAQGSKSWSALTKEVSENWATEYQLANA